DGAAKLWLLREGLEFRKRAPDLFLEGAYVPLRVDGAHADHAFAFARRRSGNALVCVVPRLVFGVDAAAPGFGWEGRVGGPRDLDRRYTCVLSGKELKPRSGELSLAECFATFPVALLEAM